MNKKDNREKEIKHLMYLKSEIIRKEKKELKQLKAELENIRGFSRKRKK